MALITCPECGHQISDKAETCPYCGIKQEQIQEQLKANAAATVGEAVVTSQDVTAATPVSVQESAPVVVPANSQTVAPVSAPAVTPASAPVVMPGEEGQPDEEETQKRNKGLMWILSFIIALVLCIVAYMIWSNAADEKLEAQRYEEAMLSTNIQDLKDYLVQFNDAPQEHRDSINARLALLSQEDADWSNALASGSKKTLADFIKSHPNSLHKGEAENIIDSIDYSIAVRKGTADAFAEYLKQHPDSRRAAEAQEFLDNKRASEATPEEKSMAHDVCKRFLQAINSRDEDKLLSTVGDVLTSFEGRRNVSSQAAVDFMNKLYKDDITNMNWHILNDFKVDKNVEGSDDAANLTAHFSAEQKIERTDASKEVYAKYSITAEITPDKKIVKFNLRKQ